MDIQTLTKHNPWWLRRELIEDDAHIREYERQPLKWKPEVFSAPELSRDAIYTIRGPRRVGKTTFVKLLIRSLLNEKSVEPGNLFFYSCDRVKDYNELFELLTLFLEHARARSRKRLYLFLDEISFVHEWMRAVKELADFGRLSQCTVILTGSNILDLKFSSERLPGRRGVFRPDRILHPLGFHDYVGLFHPELLVVSAEELASRHLPVLERFWEQYLTTGGFPAVINQLHQEKTILPISYEILSDWIEGDLHKAGKSEDVLLPLSERLSAHLGSSTSLSGLSKETGVSSHLTIRDYLDVLEKMFVTVHLPHFSLSERKVALKKNRKIYFTDPFIWQTLMAKAQGFLENAFAHAQDFLNDRELLSRLAEMTAVAHLSRAFERLFFGAADYEIDIVAKTKGMLRFYEVKYQTKVTLKECQLYRRFLKRNEYLTVLTKRSYEQDAQLSLIPLCIFLLKPELWDRESA